MAVSYLQVEFLIFFPSFPTKKTFLAVLGAVDINWQVEKKLHPAPLYRLSNVPDEVSIKENI